MQQFGSARRGTSTRRAGNPAALVSVLGVAGGLVLGTLFVFVSHLAVRGDSLDPSVQRQAPAVPVLSARRAPTVLSLVTRTGRVSRAVQPLAASLQSSGCLSVSWKGLDLGGVNVSQPYTPASSVKIVTSAAALEILGKDHVFETSVYGAIDGSGTVSSLFFVGGGDPILVSADYPPTEKYPTMAGTSLEKLADSVVAAGVRAVTGGIVGVDSRYDTQRWVDSWPASFRGVEGGPLGALMVNDGIVVGEAQKRDDPAIAAAVELGRLLAARGVSVVGSPQHGELPGETAKIASVTSAPLPAIVAEMLTNSDNNTAEILLKEIGFKKKGAGTTAAGAAAVGETLSAWGLDKGTTIVDGSGLSKENKVACSTFMSLLSRDVQFLPPLMAVAGTSGTLRDAFTKEAVRGRLLGKTGTLSSVKALVGYLPVDGDDPVVFSLILNREGVDNQSAYRPIWYALGDALNRAKGSPSPDQLAP